MFVGGSLMGTSLRSILPGAWSTRAARAAYSNDFPGVLFSLPLLSAARQALKASNYRVLSRQ